MGKERNNRNFTNKEKERQMEEKETPLGCRKRKMKPELFLD